MPRHSETAKFIEVGIFEGLKTFSELESRISALPLEKDRGDAFEVFAEGYLATQPICQTTEVWPQQTAPSVMLSNLGLPIARDMGTDGLVELKDGRIASYQAKFYSGRPSLNWGTLSTFFAISDRVNHTIIFTNTDSLANTIEDRKNFIAIRGTDLDRLCPEDFSVICAWINGTQISKKRFEPLPHQTKALDDLLSHLQTEDRATVLMACGTGKTLVTLWAAERLQCRNILVLVPSLALIQQTLYHWLAATKWENLAYLCVCSDPSVIDGGDELIVRKSDLDFEVTTDSEDVERFLSTQYDGVKIVFSTYQSARVVGQAVNGKRLFEIGIFDEAHKTAGHKDKAYAFALSDTNLPIAKRLFVTATPRHYNILKRDSDGEAQLVYSMDNPDLYGRIVHKLPFAEAARKNIICKYKIVISVVTSEMLQKDALAKGHVLIEGDEIHAQQVANQIAIAEAVNKYSVAKIITFHKNVKSAKSFSSAESEGVQRHLKEFSVFHVNGSMPSGEREKYMREFRVSAKGVVSNAKCLTEGVDVPAVDMVAFLSPKRSTVDIVQATGRAMRKSSNKEFGYVLVPLYLELKSGETIEEAVQQGNFEEVWDVLSALQEQDEVLADIVRQMRETQGRLGGFDDTRFREVVEILGPSLSLDALRKSITAECVEKLGGYWDRKFGELLAYKEKHGDCDVPWKWTDNPGLHVWVIAQRFLRRANKLIPERFERLNALGFNWGESFEDGWDSNFTKLEKYKAENGHCNVPQNFPADPALGLWVANSRRSGNSGKLVKERVDRLNAIGFAWDPRQDEWLLNYGKLKQYFEMNGNSNVPQKWHKDPALSRWVTSQRQYRKMGRVSDENIKLLDSLNFEWARHELNWENYFKELLAFKAKYGHCDVSSKHECRKELRIWVTKQRALKKKGELPQDVVEKLDGVGFLWQSR